MHGISESQFQFGDLHDHMDSAAFEQFVDLYRNAFPVASEREEPELFLERLTTEPAATQPRFHLLIARRAPDNKVHRHSSDSVSYSRRKAGGDALTGQ